MHQERRKSYSYSAGTLGNKLACRKKLLMFRSQWLWFPLYVFCLVHGCHSVVLRLDTINTTFIDVCSLAFSFQWCKRKLCKRKVYSVQSKRVKKIIKEQYKKLGKIRYAKFRHAACKKSKFNVMEL